MTAEYELEKFRAVNKAASLEELAIVIEEKIADPVNMTVEISDNRTMQLEMMLHGCRNFDPKNHPTLLTRRYGIRQQAYMLHAQGKIKKKDEN